jgi:pimeloyl-ACP methyl ester carboxylesterase
MAFDPVTRFSGAVRSSVLALLLSALLRVAAHSDSAAEPRPPGRLIDIGGYRLHVHATGRGSPTVVLLSGMGDYSFVWSLVQPQISRFARVCSYDRAGDAWSDLGPVPRTMRQDVYELHLLLRKAKLPPPYVMVGASYGGLLARLYAEEYRGEVGGIVLVDSTHEDTILSFGQMKDGKSSEKLMRVRSMSRGLTVPPPQTMLSSPPKPPTDQQRKEFEEIQKMFGPPKIEAPFDRLPQDAQELQLWARSHQKLSGPSEGYMGEEFSAMYEVRRRNPQPHGDMPLISLRAGGQGPTPSPDGLASIGMTLEEWRREWQERSADHARLSSNSRSYTASGSGHHIHLEDPELVAFAIRRVVDAVRSRAKL